MKTLLTTFALIVLIFSANVFAGDVLFNACTKDGFTAVLKLDINDEAMKAQPKVVLEIAAAFKYAANTLTAEQLVGAEGWMAFAGKLTEEDNAAIDTLYGPPVVDPNFTCKVANVR